MLYEHSRKDDEPSAPLTGDSASGADSPDAGQDAPARQLSAEPAGAASENGSGGAQSAPRSAAQAPRPPQTPRSEPAPISGTGSPSTSPFARPASRPYSEPPLSRPPSAPQPPSWAAERPRPASGLYGTPAPAESAVRPAPAARPAIAEPQQPPPGLLDMVDGEEVLQEVDSGDDGRFILTSRRLIYHGKTFENSLFSSAAVEDVTSVELSRRPRDMRSAWWGVAGAIAAILVWQVTTNRTVGLIAGAAVGAIAALLLADFWFRPPGLVLTFSTPGGKVEGPVSGKKMRDAEQLAARLQHVRNGGSGSGRRPRSTGQMSPPGGSPGLF